MIPDGARMNRRQLLSVCLVGLLSPLVRQLPRIAALSAGSAGWLCPLASAPLLGLFALLLRRLTKRRAAGEGMGEVFLRVYGRGLGGAILALYALWMLSYAGFVIAAGAARLTTSAYPKGGRLFFVIAASLFGLLAALSKPRTLARTANVLRPFLLLTLTAILLGGLLSGDARTLLPVTRADALPVLEGGARTADVLLLAAAFSFLLADVEPEPGRRPLLDLLRLGGTLALLGALLTAAVLADFGEAFTLAQEHPFLAMTRNLRMEGTIERIDALVIGLWVGADFVLLAAMLLAARAIARLLLGGRNGPLPGVLCAAGAAAFALLYGAGGAGTDWLAERFFPISGAEVSFGLWPLTLAVGALRKRI